MTCPRKRFRELLARPGIISSLGVHDVFRPASCSRRGLELAFLGGFGVVGQHARAPRPRLLTQTEMAEAIRRVVSARQFPSWPTATPGHGELHNVVRTVQQFERAGAAGILLEDQVSQKRCGHFAGKEVVSVDEMLIRLHAALDARVDPDFAIFARTDALATHGIDEAIDRANRYGDCGADVCFVEAPAPAMLSRELAAKFATRSLPNMLTGGKTPILSAGELEAAGLQDRRLPARVTDDLRSRHSTPRGGSACQRTGRLADLRNDVVRRGQTGSRC